LPGFTDSHVHFTQTGLGSLGPQVYGITARAAVLEIIAAAVDSAAGGEAILMHGCSFHDLDQPLTLAQLDRLSPNNPVMVADMGAHACAINSLALSRVGLPADIPGIDRNPDGTLAGLLRGPANTRARYTYYDEVVSDDARMAALNRASPRALEVGITTVHALDGGSPDGRGWLPQRTLKS